MGPFSPAKTYSSAMVGDRLVRPCSNVRRNDLGLAGPRGGSKLEIGTAACGDFPLRRDQVHRAPKLIACVSCPARGERRPVPATRARPRLESRRRRPSVEFRRLGTKEGKVLGPNGGDSEHPPRGRRHATNRGTNRWRRFRLARLPELLCADAVRAMRWANRPLASPTLRSRARKWNVRCDAPCPVVRERSAGREPATAAARVPPEWRRSPVASAGANLRRLAVSFERRHGRANPEIAAIRNDSRKESAR